MDPNLRSLINAYKDVYEEKKAKKDYDGDGKIESGKEEYFGSKDKAIKKAMGKKVEESAEADEYIETVQKIKKAETQDDIKRWEQLTASGKFTAEEIESLKEAERSIDDRLERKNKLMDKTVKKAMDFARNEGEASGHARYNMSRLGDERAKLIAKKK
jgi:hypothetical protein